MAEFQNSRPLHKVALRVGFGVSLIDSAVEGLRAMRIEDIDEVIPDSEEERIQRSKMKGRAHTDGENDDVIELTSDEEEYIHVRRPDAGKTPRARRVVLSSDSEASDNEGVVGTKTLPQVQVPQPATTRRSPLRSMGPIIDLTVSSSESETEDTMPAKTSKVNIKSTQRPTSRSAVSHRPTSSQDDKLRSTIPLYADDDSDGDVPMNNNDGSILVLDEPRSARKPLRTTNLSHPTRKIPSASVPSTPIHRIVSIHSTDSEESDTDVESEASVRSAKPAARPKKTTATKAPRLSKKALEAAEQQRRERYAKTFFNEMNRTVFGHGLPDNTTLFWNKRLVSTAGKAKWQRNREGVQTSEIELAVKILTSDERIRNTLSHEMCHLASWIISDDPTENHGSIFHGWASKIMRARPEIEITTKHNYEIDYKYEWKCLECAKVYGRFSKSINPDECVCGACKVGKLIPLFATNTRPPKTPRSKAGSAMASAKGRDSPLATSSPFLLREENVNIRVDIHVPRGAPSSAWTGKTKTHIPGAFPLGDDEYDYDDEDDDVEVLTRAIGGVKL